MTSLTVRFDLGAGVTPAQFARLATDFSSFVDLAQRWAEREAVRDSTDYIRRQRHFEIDTDTDHYQFRENDIADLRSFNQNVELWDGFGDTPFDIWLEGAWHWYNRRSGIAGPANSLPLNPLGGPPSLESFAPELFSRLVAQEARKRRPRPLTLHSVHYRNPIDFSLLEGAIGGGLLVGIVAISRLLEVMKDYTKSGRRRRSAEADEAEASARLKAAGASKAELHVEFIEALASNENSEGLRMGTLLEIIDENDDTLKMLARIADLEPTALSTGAGE